jgi:hypothetical protein
MSSLLRTDPKLNDDKKQKHLKRFYSKVVTKTENLEYILRKEIPRYKLNRNPTKDSEG